MLVSRTLAVADFEWPSSYDDNVGVEKGDEVSVFILGTGALFENGGSEQFDVTGQMSKFRGDETPESR